MEANDPSPPIPGVPTDRTILSVLEELRADGYLADLFVTADGLVRCGSCRHDHRPDDLELHAIRRLEGASDPADEAAVLALSCARCGTRGTAIVRYGPEAGPHDVAVLRAIEDLRR